MTITSVPARPSRQAATPPVATGGGAERRAEHLLGADLLRALAAFAVIVNHVAHWPSQDSGADQSVWGGVVVASRFCVPAFVILSGLLLAHRGPAGDRGSFLRRRLSRSLLPWLVWAPVFVLVTVFWTGETPMTAGGVAGFLETGAGHLYYLLLVPQLYLLYLVWPRGPRACMALAAGGIVLQALLDVARLEGWFGGALQAAALQYGFLAFPFWIGYFAAGIAIARVLRDNTERPRLALLMAALTVPAAALVLTTDVSRFPYGSFGDGTGGFLRASVIPLSLTVAATALLAGPTLMRRSGRLRRTIETVGRYSLGIYIIHPLLLITPGHLLQPNLLAQHLPVSIFGTLVLTGVALLGALVLTRLLVATPLAPIVGEARRPLRRRSEPEVDLRGRAAVPGERAAMRRAS